MTLHSYHARTYRDERRRTCRRAIKWVISFSIWGILIGVWVFTQQLQAAS